MNHYPETATDVMRVWAFHIGDASKPMLITAPSLFDAMIIAQSETSTLCSRFDQEAAKTP